MRWAGGIISLFVIVKRSFLVAVVKVSPEVGCVKYICTTYWVIYANRPLPAVLAGQSLETAQFRCGKTGPIGLTDREIVQNGYCGTWSVTPKDGREWRARMLDAHISEVRCGAPDFEEGV